MSGKAAKILTVFFAGVAAIALIVFLVSLLHKETPEEPKATPTPTVTITVPKGSVLVWRVSEVNTVTYEGEKYCSARYEYDDRGLCIAAYDYVADSKEPFKTAELSYDVNTKYTTVTEMENRGQESLIPLSGVAGYNQKSVRVLDPAGRIMIEEVYDYTDGDYVLRYRYEYEYDQDGYVTRRREFSIGDDGVYYMHGERTYDWLGNILTEYVLYGSAGSGTWDRNVYVRDGYGHIIEDRSERPTGNGDETEVYVHGTSELDSQGRVVRRTTPAYYAEDTKVDYWRDEYHYFDNGGWQNVSYGLDDEMHEVIEYDAYGNKIREANYFEGKLTRSREWEYEPARGGNMLKYSGHGNDPGDEFSYRYEYDDDGNRILVEALQDGEWQTITREEYNDAGQIVRRERTGYTCEYFYDENGNCTESVSTSMYDGTKSTDSFIYEPIVITEEEARLAGEYYQPVKWTVPYELLPDHLMS
ncbi:MAG: hypothetical protein J6Y67_02290 [Lachnospiraceae bacterium]|nr:hypothetical protein [Lachnospiraceae bacterium]